ncbi:Uncharacterised protein [Vibrio cholerae]|nr:Uncharacterised protein [Vibrio cholerae]
MASVQISATSIVCAYTCSSIHFVIYWCGGRSSGGVTAAF